jgi:hypothetical protein
MISFAQMEIQEVTWEELKVETFETATSAATGIEYSKPVYSEEQQALHEGEIIISGNFHVLNNFGSKTFLLSKDEIIKTPMQRDEVIRLIMVEDPEIYFGRKVKIKGILHIDENEDAETIYYITDVKKIKNTGTVEGEEESGN